MRYSIGTYKVPYFLRGFARQAEMLAGRFLCRNERRDHDEIKQFEPARQTAFSLQADCRAQDADAARTWRRGSVCTGRADCGAAKSVWGSAPPRAKTLAGRSRGAPSKVNHTFST